jgi:hypothetical protein
VSYIFTALEPQASMKVLFKSGANPTIVSYNATGSLAHLENKNILFYFEKRSSLGTYYNAGVKAVNSKVVGLAPGNFAV